MLSESLQPYAQMDFAPPETRRSRNHTGRARLRRAPLLWEIESGLDRSLALPGLGCAAAGYSRKRKNCAPVAVSTWKPLEAFATSAYGPPTSAADCSV